MSQTDETTLIKRSKQKDKAAYGRLVERYSQPAFSFAFSYVKNRDDAVTVSQDAFIRAWRAIDTFIEGRSFRSWLFSIVRNLCLNCIDKRKRLRESSLDEAMEESGFDIPDCSEDQLDRLERREREAQVWKAVMGLKDDFREIIVLKHFNDMSYQEISDSLNIPPGTVMSRLYYARLALRDSLEDVALRS